MKNQSRIVVYGAGVSGKEVVKQIYNNHDYLGKIVAFIDRYSMEKTIFGIPVYKPEKIKDLEYDFIVLAAWNRNSFVEMEALLDELGVSKDKIIKNMSYFHGTTYNATRINFLENSAWMIKLENIQGNVAECGVYKGDFAKFINRMFYDKTLYLFDTFEGFNSSDIEKEELISHKEFKKGNFVKSIDMYELTNVDEVMSKMDYPDKVVIRKGWFPDTAEGIEDSFCFVNLDTDLCQPIYEGLKFFWPKMSRGGVVMIHDYFSPHLPGVKKAIDDYEEYINERLHRTAVGDGFSVALIK